MVLFQSPSTRVQLRMDPPELLPQEHTHAPCFWLQMAARVDCMIGCLQPQQVQAAPAVLTRSSSRVLAAVRQPCRCLDQHARHPALDALSRQLRISRELLSHMASSAGAAISISCAVPSRSRCNGRHVEGQSLETCQRRGLLAVHIFHRLQQDHFHLEISDICV